jgi:hypothetical protein
MRATLSYTHVHTRTHNHASNMHARARTRLHEHAPERARKPLTYGNASGTRACTDTCAQVHMHARTHVHDMHLRVPVHISTLTTGASLRLASSLGGARACARGTLSPRKSCSEVSDSPPAGTVCTTVPLPAIAASTVTHAPTRSGHLLNMDNICDWFDQITGKQKKSEVTCSPVGCQ